MYICNEAGLERCCRVILNLALVFTARRAGASVPNFEMAAEQMSDEHVIYSTMTNKVSKGQMGDMLAMHAH